MSRSESRLPLTRSVTVSGMRGSVSVCPSSRQLVRSTQAAPFRADDSTRHDEANVSIERRVMVMGSSSVPLARVLRHHAGFSVQRPS